MLRRAASRCVSAAIVSVASAVVATVAPTAHADDFPTSLPATPPRASDNTYSDLAATRQWQSSWPRWATIATVAGAAIAIATYTPAVSAAFTDHDARHHQSLYPIPVVGGFAWAGDHDCANQLITSLCEIARNGAAALAAGQLVGTLVLNVGITGGILAVRGPRPSALGWTVTPMLGPGSVGITVKGL